MEAIETHLCPQSRLCPPLRYSTSTPNSNSHSSSKSTSNSSSKSRSNSAQSLDQALLLHFSHCILLKLISFVVRTPLLLSRVCCKKTNQIEQLACSYRRWYHPWWDQVQRFRIFGLACSHTMDRITFCGQKCSLVWFSKLLGEKLL